MTSFFGDLLSTISERGRSLMERREPRGERRAAEVIELAEQLLSRRGEASGVAIASEILAGYAGLGLEGRVAFFEALVHRFGQNQDRLERAIIAYGDTPGEETAQELHLAAEPRRQELFRRLNLAPAGTQSLVQMRSDLIAALEARPELSVVDRDLMHLFASWFNRGFLVVRRIDWTTPAHILEKIIRYEAVHEIRDWDDLRRRLQPSDRRCFAFFHPALGDEPLIFVEVALTREIPSAIGPLLAPVRTPLPAQKATTAVFYSISNTQKGLGGVSFGNFLIKQVVENLKRELPNLKTFVTLSPVPGFARWLERERKAEKSACLDAVAKETLVLVDETGWNSDPEKVERVRAVLQPAAAYYFLKAKDSKGRPIDPVARFHLGNGARLERLNFLGDVSSKGLKQSHGFMVNYLYALDEIEKNHEAFAEKGTVAASPMVRKALRTDLASHDLVPTP